jgi:hypothetical protein
VLRLFFRRVARNIHAELIAEVYRDGGGILTAPASELQPLIARYKLLVEKAGRETVEHSRLSADTIAELERPLLPAKTYADDFMNIVNKRCDEILSKRGGQMRSLRRS